MKERIRKFFAGLLASYLLALLVLSILWEVCGETQWLLILLRYLPGFVLMLPLPVLVLAAWNKKALLAGVLAGILGVFYFLGFEVPGRAKDGANLTVMSYNIRAGLGGPKTIAEYLLDADVDIIALQEARAPLANSEADPVPPISSTMKSYLTARGGIRGELVILKHSPLVSAAH